VRARKLPVSGAAAPLLLAVQPVSHLAVHGSKPWLSGSIYWALQEFRVRPNWDGGNPRPNPPVHEKGLLRLLPAPELDAQRLAAEIDAASVMAIPPFTTNLDGARQSAALILDALAKRAA